MARTAKARGSKKASVKQPSVVKSMFDWIEPEKKPAKGQSAAVSSKEARKLVAEITANGQNAGSLFRGHTTELEQAHARIRELEDGYKHLLSRAAQLQDWIQWAHEIAKAEGLYGAKRPPRSASNAQQAVRHLISNHIAETKGAQMLAEARGRWLSDWSTWSLDLLRKQGLYDTAKPRDGAPGGSWPGAHRTREIIAEAVATRKEGWVPPALARAYKTSIEQTAKHINWVLANTTDGKVTHASLQTALNYLTLPRTYADPKPAPAPSQKRLRVLVMRVEQALAILDALDEGLKSTETHVSLPGFMRDSAANKRKILSQAVTALKMGVANSSPRASKKQQPVIDIPPRKGTMIKLTAKSRR